MTVQVRTDFFAALNAIPEVSTNIGSDKVLAVLIPAPTELPAISVRINDGTRPLFYRDSFGLTEYDAQVDVYAKDYATLTTVAEAIVSTFDGFVGTLGMTIFQPIIVINTLETVDPDEPDVFRRIITLTLTV